MDSDAVWDEDRLPGQVEAKDLVKTGGWDLVLGQDWQEVWAADPENAWAKVLVGAEAQVVVVAWEWVRDLAGALVAESAEV